MTITAANDTVTSGGRSIGLLGAVSVGVGAIVGGGILALAGVAFGNVIVVSIWGHDWCATLLAHPAKRILPEVAPRPHQV